jgi:hypothetical protein
MMTKHEIRQYKSVTSEDQRTFDRWLKVSAVVGSIFAAVVVVIAIAASDPGPRDAGATSPKSTASGTSEWRRSAYELMIGIAPHQLPVERVDRPF